MISQTLLVETISKKKSLKLTRDRHFFSVSQCSNQKFAFWEMLLDHCSFSTQKCQFPSCKVMKINRRVWLIKRGWCCDNNKQKYYIFTLKLSEKRISRLGTSWRLGWRREEVNEGIGGSIRMRTLELLKSRLWKRDKRSRSEEMFRTDWVKNFKLIKQIKQQKWW